MADMCRSSCGVDIRGNHPVRNSKMRSRRKSIGRFMFAGEASLIIFVGLFIAQPNFAKSDPVELWLTQSDRSALLQKQSARLTFGPASNKYPVITVDETQMFQS